MTGNEATLALIDSLEALSIPYMLVGSYSSNIYGVPRSTEDADFVIELGAHSISQIADCLGPEFLVDSQTSFETVTLTFRHIVRVVNLSFKLELFHLSGDEHDQLRFQRRRRITTMGRPVCVPTVEDVIITKLRWSKQAGRSKDRDDVRDVIAVQGDRIDWTYVQSWCDRHGTRALLDEIRASIPPIDSH
jgi:hypothetical protein